MSGTTETKPGKYEAGWEGDPLRVQQLEALQMQHEAAKADNLRLRTELDMIRPMLGKASGALSKARDKALAAWDSGTFGHDMAARLPVDDLHLLIQVLVEQRNEARSQIALMNAIEDVRDRVDEITDP